MSEESSERTLSHYQRNAERFWEGTRDHDVSQNLDALLGALRDARGGEGPFRVLDFGCGPGRDLAELARRGHVPTGLDGCAAFAAMARSHAGCEVLQQDFVDLALPPASFDGIFANASLFHVPSAHLPHVLGELFRALVAPGILFCSNPRGDDVEGFQGERYGCYFQEPRWSRYFQDAGFVPVRHYYRPDGLPREQQPWLAMVFRRDA
jgi:SAM-dependent methyltransferase